MTDTNPTDVTQDLQGKTRPGLDSEPVEHPEHIGRYRVERVLGKGGFGLVYLAHDDQLDRFVAIKVPHAKLISKPEDAEAYLAEARTVANLDHPGIVPVHDVGSTPECACFIVSKYIEGTDLASRIEESRLGYTETAELIVTVAEALHYAHTQGLVHRDVKPGNILIGKDGRPYVVDFGLALREENIGKGPKFAGTPAYMSPEQARGEGHRVDGRSDIFSLGVVLYELLVGRKPFRGDTQAALMKQVTSFEPRPLRQYDEKMPKELERICYKAMAKRASERYASAHDFVKDLLHYLSEPVFRTGPLPPGVASTTPETVATNVAPTSLGSHSASSLGFGSSSDNQPVKIVPKGLRSFDAHDADFFLELLPGPRDREGLPDSLRFWKTRIEETDADSTFSVGLIYGPSGCGKSSLVKAGLLPRVHEDVLPIYIEATPEETESRLLRGLQKRCPDLDEKLSLKEVLKVLRRDPETSGGRKVLIVIDQFEQWLHAKKEEENTDLVQALRQCDGGRVQCIVMVRDDFWLAVSRFGMELEVDFVPGTNMALVDLFDVDHARRVLAAFGRAFGRLDDQVRETSKEQKEFLKESVAGLAEEGKVICVRLALFAEMMKGKEWTPVTLKAVGGTSGVGATFLDETFSASTAAPRHRLHQKAARAVLQDLLPDSGTDIKGYMRSYAELLEASGYNNRPKDFDDLIRILDSEVRLITPTDPAGVEADGELTAQAESGQKYFQLTHDYLVHSLRNWLTSKQKETRQGRAELRLSELSVTWNAKPENRFLPSWWENLNFRLLTDRAKWTDPQRKMMGKAGVVHGIRSAIFAMLILAVVAGGLTIRAAINRNQQEIVAQKREEQNDAEATRLVEGLLQANTSQVKTIIDNLEGYRKWARDDLTEAYESSPPESNAKLHAALAMLPQDDAVLPFLQDRLLSVAPTQFEHVRNLLADHKHELIASYWQTAKSSGPNAARRFQAACALASYDGANEHWQDEAFGKFLAGHLVNVLPSELLPWQRALLPVKDQLTDHLAAIYRNDSRGEQVRLFATDTLADYLSDDAERLFQLLADAGQKQFPPIFDKLVAFRDQAIALGNAEVQRSLDADADAGEREAMAMRQANVAVMLLKMNAPEQVWPLLKHTPDPRVRSYIIHWLSPLGGDPQTMIDRYEKESDKTIQRALLLCLGEFDDSQYAEGTRDALIEKLLDVYRTDPDAGLHSAAEWLLRRWKQADRIAVEDERLRQTDVERLKAAEEGKKEKGKEPRRWYVNGRGQTYVILSADEFQMGSPDSELGRTPNENLHQRRIGREFAIANKEVTKAQWREFSRTYRGRVWPADQPRLAKYVTSDDSPILGITWYEAAWYCNWLSAREGIPRDQWCYDAEEAREYGPGMRAKSNFLDLTGYRMPTESEWEFACRAGARTRRHYGESDTLLPRYAWYQATGKNHAWPVAKLKPNDFGLFDVQGNAFEWVYDAFRPYPAATDSAAPDEPGSQAVPGTVRRLLRGGSFLTLSPSIRSAYRGIYLPGNRIINLGLRPARTHRPGKPAAREDL